MIMKKYPEEMSKEELKSFCEKLERIGKKSKAISFNDWIFQEHIRELGIKR